MNHQSEIMGIQLPDDIHMESTVIRFVTFHGPVFNAGAFIIVSCPSGRSYFASVTGPQINLNRDGLSACDITTVNQMEKVHNEEYARDMVVQEFHYYKAALLREVTGDQVSSIRVRSQIASNVRKATAEEVSKYMGLPSGPDTRPIGVLIDSEIPLSIDRRTFRLHILLAGATGSGKSNTAANVIDAARDLGLFVIVYDHKPDYQHVDEVNDELPFGISGHPLSGASFWSLGGDDARLRDDEATISVPAPGLDMSMLAQTIFYKESETLQAEIMEAMLFKYKDERNGNMWSIHEFIRSLPGDADKLAKSFYGMKAHEATYDALLRKLSYGKRIPSWIDSTRRQSRGDGIIPGRKSNPQFEIQSLARGGSVAILRIPGSQNSGRSYGLFLSYILNEAYRLRERDPGSPGILHVIDEAQDIFSAGSNFKAAAGGMLNRNMRKGRSRNISFLICVQSADAVPTDIRNNCNSVILQRHNNAGQAKEASDKMTREQLAMTATFGPGEALVDLRGASGVVHCRMFQSPFMLTKE